MEEEPPIPKVRKMFSMFAKSKKSVKPKEKKKGITIIKMMIHYTSFSSFQVLKM